MAKLDLPFYASPEEIINWIERWVQIKGVTLVAVRFPPISFTEVTRKEIRKQITDPFVKQCSFLIRPFDSSIKYQIDFCERYPDQMILNIGHRTSDGLQESWLGYKTDNSNAIAIWKQIVKDIKSNTKPGITLTNFRSGVTSIEKRYRYSHGAQVLESQGVPMLPLAGKEGASIKLGYIHVE